MTRRFTSALLATAALCACGSSAATALPTKITSCKDQSVSGVGIYSIKASNLGCGSATKLARRWYTQRCDTFDSCKVSGFRCSSSSLPGDDSGLQVVIRCKKNAARVTFQPGQ